jgi:ferredoxin
MHQNLTTPEPSLDLHRPPIPATPLPDLLDPAWLRELALACGADAAGVVEVEREALKGDVAAMEAMLPGVKSVVSLLVRVNADALRGPWMGVANRSARFAEEGVDRAASELSRRLQQAGLRSVAVHASFPMDVHREGRIWPLAHKVLAEQAGLGTRGHNRLLLHPEFGAAVVLAAVLVDRPAAGTSAPLERSPCNGCGLCVEACPTGAIGKDGAFSLVNCAAHNYRFRLGGFNAWVETLVDSRDRRDYRKRVRPEETMGIWQSLTTGANHACMNCMAVCPVGQGRPKPPAPRGKDLVRQLLDRGGQIHVIRGSDAEVHARARFQPERIRIVSSGNRLTTARGFLQALPILFQPGQAEGLEVAVHFEFTGADPCGATAILSQGRLRVAPGLEGNPDVTVMADGPTWVAIASGLKGILPAILTRKLRLRGSRKAFRAFMRCFPS